MDDLARYCDRQLADEEPAVEREDDGKLPWYVKATRREELHQAQLKERELRSKQRAQQLFDAWQRQRNESLGRRS